MDWTFRSLDGRTDPVLALLAAMYQLWGTPPVAPCTPVAGPHANIRISRLVEYLFSCRSPHRVFPWPMDPDQESLRSARRVIRIGHVLMGGAALVFSGVMMFAGRAPNAGLGGVFVGLGLLLALAATLFTYVAVLLILQGHDGRGGSLSLILSVVELLAGAAVAAGLGNAVQGYGSFEPWRSPLLLPTVLLVAFGLAGLALEVVARRHQTH